MCTEANEFACWLQAAVSFSKPCLFFGVLSNWGYCLNVWTFKGCAGRLDAAKYLVERITISAISELPQSPALPLSVSQAGEERMLSWQGLSCRGDSSSGKSEGLTCHCRGGRKVVGPLTSTGETWEQREPVGLPPNRCVQEDVPASSSGVQVIKGTTE